MLEWDGSARMPIARAVTGAKRLRPLVLLAAATVTTACDILAVTCSAELRPNLAVEVRDAASGAPAAAGASGWAVSGSYSIELAPIDALRMRERGDNREHAGPYVVRIEKPGYRDWTAADVHVEEDECHVRTRTLEARLVPEAAQLFRRHAGQ